MSLKVERTRFKRICLGEGTLRFEKAFRISMSMESTRKYFQAMQGTQTNDSETHIHRLLERSDCYHCRDTAHLAYKYPFENKICFKYGRIEHTRQKCRQDEDRPINFTTYKRKGLVQVWLGFMAYLLRSRLVRRPCKCFLVKACE